MKDILSVPQFSHEIAKTRNQIKEEAVKHRMPQGISVEDAKEWIQKHNARFEQENLIAMKEWLSVDGVRTDEIETFTEEYPLRITTEWRKLVP